MSKKAKKSFLGIIVAANTRAEAEKEFVSVATGKDYLTLEDEAGKFNFLTTSESSGMMNPRTGAMDLVETESASGLKFVSSSSDELKAEYTVCADGCGSHIISEASEVVSHCPRCSSELRSLSDEEIENLSSDSFDSDETDAEVGGIVVASDSLESALEQYVELSTSSVEGKYIKTANEETFMTSQSCELKFNPFDGDESLSVVDTPEEFDSVSSDGEGNINAHYYLCANEECETRHVVSTSEDAIICPSCSGGLTEPDGYEGDELKVTASLDEEETNEEESTSTEETVAELESDSKASKSEDDDEEEEDDSDEEDEEEDDSEDDDSEDDDSEDDEEEDLESDSKASKSEDDDEEEEDDSDEEDEEEDDSEDDEEEDDEEEEDDDKDLSASKTSESADEMEFISINGLEIAESSNALDAKNLHVTFAGSIKGVPTWIAMCNGIHVASANPVTASKHADLFTSKTFGEAVCAVAKDNGVEYALKEMGFEIVSHELEVQPTINRMIDKEVTDKVMSVQASAKEELDSMEERYQAALATAFVGIDKGIWKAKTNPVKEALVSSLSTAGVRNADRLVDNCFEKHGDGFIKTALSKANELMSLTSDAQNEISSMVKESNYRSSTGSLENRLSSIATDVDNKNDVEEEMETVSSSSEKSNLDMNAILRGLGKRRF